VEFEIVPGGIPEERERKHDSEAGECNEQGWERKESFLTRSWPNILGMLVQLSSISVGAVLSNVAAIGWGFSAEVERFIGQGRILRLRNDF
jgi:hypothetical protein